MKACTGISAIDGSIGVAQSLGACGGRFQSACNRGLDGQGLSVGSLVQRLISFKSLVFLRCLCALGQA